MSVIRVNMSLNLSHVDEIEDNRRTSINGIHEIFSLWLRIEHNINPHRNHNSVNVR